MRLTNAFRLAAGLLAFTLPAASAWSASQQKQHSISSSETSPLAPVDSQKPQKQPEVKFFIGKISKIEQKLVLEDAITDTSYQLDDQKKAKQFEGKIVRVTGTLDAQNNLIHVQVIEETA